MLRSGIAGTLNGLKIQILLIVSTVQHVQHVHPHLRPLSALPSILQPHQTHCPQRSPLYVLFPLLGPPTLVYISIPRILPQGRRSGSPSLECSPRIQVFSPGILTTVCHNIFTQVLEFAYTPTPFPDQKLRVGGDWVPIVSSVLSPPARPIVGPRAQCHTSSFCWVGREVLSGCSKDVGEEGDGEGDGEDRSEQHTPWSSAGPGPALGFGLIHQRLQDKETLESSSSASPCGREMLISERERPPSLRSRSMPFQGPVSHARGPGDGQPGRGGRGSAS